MLTAGRVPVSAVKQNSAVLLLPQCRFVCDVLRRSRRALCSGRDGAGAASPGRALQGVRDKLSAFMAKQQQHEQPPPPPETQAVVQRGMLAPYMAVLSFCLDITPSTCLSWFPRHMHWHLQWCCSRSSSCGSHRLMHMAGWCAYLGLHAEQPLFMCCCFAQDCFLCSSLLAMSSNSLSAL